MKKIWTFLLLTFLLSAVFYAMILSLESLQEADNLVFGLMWCPGISAIITVLIFDKNIRGLGWKLGKAKYLLLSFLIPISYALIPYSIVWVTGLGKFVPSNFEENILVFWTSGLALSCLSALGEEIGWRGFLVPELSKRMNFLKTSLISGFVWALWHVPGIVFSDYNNGAGWGYSLIMFFILVLGVSFLFAWLRLRSGSLWTAVIIHGVHNLFVQGYLDVVTEDTGITKYITGEFGVALALSAVVVAFIFWKKRSQVMNI